MATAKFNALCRCFRFPFGNTGTIQFKPHLVQCRLCVLTRLLYCLRLYLVSRRSSVGGHTDGTGHSQHADYECDDDRTLLQHWTLLSGNVCRAFIPTTAHH